MSNLAYLDSYKNNFTNENIENINMKSYVNNLLDCSYLQIFYILTKYLK